MVAAVQQEQVDQSNVLFEEVPTSGDAVPMEGVVEVQEQPAGAAADQDAEMRGEYLWTVRNFSKLTEKEYSQKFEIGTHLWRMLLCPKGLHADKTYVSVFLDSPEAGWVPDHLNPRATFKLSILCQTGAGEDFCKESNHKWSKDASDWGFTQFLPYADAINPDKGYLVDDSIQIKVEIQVQRNERYAYDSRKETGHVGLKNQGATCYMNSLLQYLYHLPYLRKAVYHMPTSENDEPCKSLPLALQSLFYKLQYARTPASTKDLTASFGWSTVDAFMQHDVQELNRVLCEKLEEKMKGTRVEHVINELFEGHTSNYLECVNIDYTSSRRESFMDLQLDVKGCANIYDSFNKYTEVEMMVGDNQYKAEGHGLQDARKGVLFDDFPPVLQLQLKRFEYDFQRDTMVKINDRYEFFDELDLDREDGRYLSKQADRSVRNLYKLHSVLVHSGGLHGGHYYAFIRPDGSRWLKFDDTSVTLEDDAKALEEQYGGDEGGPMPMQTGPDVLPSAAGGAGGACVVPAGPLPPKRTGPLKFMRYSNAYMLVYVRASDWGRIMCPVTKDDIAPYLRERLEAEQADKEKRQKEKQEAHLYCHVRVATDADIAAQIGSSQWFDLVDYEKLDASRTFRVRKLTQFTDFKEQVAAALGVPVEKQRYWVWNQRQNHTSRPTARLKASDEAQTLVDLKEYRAKEDGRAANAKHALMDLRFYLEVPWPPGKSEQGPQGRDEINLFFKYYDWKTEKLSYVGHRYLNSKLKVAHLHKLLWQYAGLPEGTPLLVFEEVKWDPQVMVTQLEPDHTLSQPGNQLESGDILCFQEAPPAELLQALQQQKQQAAAAAAAAAVPGVTGVSPDDSMMDVEQQQQQPGIGDEQQHLEQQQALSQQLSQQHLEQQQQQLVQQQAALEGVTLAGPDGQGQQVVRFPLVVDFLSYIVNRRLVTFKRLEEPKEEGLQLELLKDNSYDLVTSALAAKLGLSDPTVLRLTQHNAYSLAPQRSPIRYRGFDSLEFMLRHAGHAVDVLYYEVLDIPLPQLEQLKTLRVQFHNDKTEFVGEHVVRVPREGGCVGDVLAEMSRRVGAEYAGRPLRLLEVYQSKIYKVLPPSEQVATWTEGYWVLRVEPIPQEEEGPLGEGEMVLRVAHIAAPKQQQAPSTPTTTAGCAEPPAGAAAADAGSGEGPASAAAGSGSGGGLIGTAPAAAAAHVAAVPFGDPFLLRVGPSETVGQVRARIQEKLGVAAAEFEGWKLAHVSTRTPPHYLADSDIVSQVFPAQQAVATEVDYLGLEHEDKGGLRRPASSTSRYTYERAIKIHN